MEDEAAVDAILAEDVVVVAAIILEAGTVVAETLGVEVVVV